MKKITFDEEELFAIAVFEPDTRINTISGLDRVLPELQDDPEMRDLVRSAREKLKRSLTENIHCWISIPTAKSLSGI